ncbi:PD-(D/E)XK nuclease family protein [uncultured Arcanobacterium sp.]|uniref:RecB family exonuclease n=1 Tax=uncultured Arcanobacterium sp. TaxID=487520 RepID=UPI00260850EB|nr:PD-(D/E)XK nuclease family protein [uncultured Arcanobacterium sp.]
MNSTHAALSPSRINEFQQCPFKFRLRTIDKIAEIPSREALRGTLVHSVLENLFLLPAAERSEEQAQEMLIPRWEAHLEKHPESLEIFPTAAEIAPWLESARPLLKNYFDLENPQYLEPAQREMFINAYLPSGLAIRGIIDRLDKNTAGDIRIVDYKTGKSPKPQFQEDAIFQLLFYAAALYFRDGKLPLRAQLLYLKNSRILSYDPVEADIDLFCRQVDSVWKNILHSLEERYFAPRTSQLCNWCSFQKFCPAFGASTPPWNEEGAAQLLTVQRADS